MERNVTKLGLVNVILLLLAGAVGITLSRYSETLSGQAGSVFFGLGLLVALVSYFQMRLEERERFEQLDFEEISRERAGSSLFETPDAETFPAKKSREQFERFFLPGFTVVLLLIEGFASWFLWRWLDQAIVTPLRQPMVAIALFGVIALTLFLVGKYSASLARLNNDRLLRPSASFLVFGAYLAFALAVTVSLELGGVLKSDFYMARALSVLLGLLAIETLLNLIFEIYRPRLKGKVGRLVYESRMVGLLAQPEGIFTTAAHALDYQFGFKVSETWVYQFLQKTLAWLILLQVAVLILSSCFIFIGPGEQGLPERFGKSVNGGQVLEPGAHVKLPWPIDKIHRYRTKELQSFNIGFVPDKDHKSQERTVLWTVAHEKEEFNLLIASRETQVTAGMTNNPANDQGAPVDLMTVGIPVQYQIKDVKAWAYNYVNAGQLLEKIAMREVIRYLMAVDLFEVMSSGRGKASEEIKVSLQKAADDLKLGVHIVFVGVEDIHPPVKVAPEFEKVVGIRQDNEAKMRLSEGYVTSVVTRASAEAQRRVNEAQSYKIERISAAVAQAAQFTNQVSAYNAAPSVFMQRSYLQALSRGATNARKTVIISTNKQGIMMLNLEDKIREISDIEVPSPRK